ncbi:MAG: C40 family peptidase [Acidobacteria bacterium]|nr:C40 family peptidase [Acidobacteriota bacterium]
MRALSRSLRLAGAVVAAATMAACASGGAVPRPFPTPGGSSGAPAPARPEAPRPDDEIPVASGAEKWNPIALTGTALALRGAPYRNGGVSPAGFDCSGFVQYVFGRHGLSMPRETREQFRVGRSVKKDDLRPGDLVFFSTIAPGASHVGIVTDTDQFVHAPSERGVVRTERLSADYWRRRFIGARRAGPE